MTDEAEALARFKSFVASIEYTEDHYALAAKLGEAKALWGAAALSLDVVRRVKPPLITEETRQKATGLLRVLGLVKPVQVDRRV